MHRGLQTRRCSLSVATASLSFSGGREGAGYRAAYLHNNVRQEREEFLQHIPVSGGRQDGLLLDGLRSQLARGQRNGQKLRHSVSALATEARRKAHPRKAAKPQIILGNSLAVNHVLESAYLQESE